MKKITVIPMLGAAVALTASTDAATMVWSLTPPTVDGADISNMTSSVDDAGNVGGGDDASTYVANNQPGKGQTITTGDNAAGYTLYSFTYQQAPYDHNYSVDDGWIGFGGFWISAGEISGGTYDLALANEFVDPGDTSTIPALDGSGNTFGTSSAYATWTFTTPISLAPSTTYAFAVWSDNPYFELAGTNDSNAYTGGEAFGDSGGTVVTQTGDHVFHVDMVANVPEPSIALLGGLGLLGLLRRRRA